MVCEKISCSPKLIFLKKSVISKQKTGFVFDKGRGFEYALLVFYGAVV